MPSIINATTSTGLVTTADNSGSLQLATNNGTTAMTIDTSQNVGVGTASPTQKLQVVGRIYSYATSAGQNLMDIGASRSTDYVQIRGLGSPLASNGYTVFGIQALSNLTGTNNVIGNAEWAHEGTGTDDKSFYTISTNSGSSTSERMRIDSRGYVGIGSSPAAWIGNEQFTVKGLGPADQYVTTISQGSSSPTAGCCLFLNYTGATPNNTTAQFLQCNDNSGVSKLVIYSNGTVSNRTGTYNSLSDAKLKENIVDATPKLDKLMQTQVRNYNLIGDELKQIGFVAQELEQIFPGLVEDVPDFDEDRQPTGEVTKMVKTSVFIPILVKAMQEQQAMIQELKAELDATKAEVAALKGAQ